MAAPTPPYTPAVAAVLSGAALKTVHNAVDRRIVETAAGATGRRASRTLSAADVLRVKLWHEIGATLSHERWQQLFQDIERRPDAKRVRANALVIVDVGEARKQIASRARDLAAAEAIVTTSPAILGGEPVFKATRIPVRTVAAMLQDGADDSEILEGYPKLRREHLALARIWSDTHPRRGRPKSLADHGLRETSRVRVPLAGDPGPKASNVSRRL